MPLARLRTAHVMQSPSLLAYLGLSRAILTVISVHHHTRATLGRKHTAHWAPV
ncbi:uncharacterized protein SETTUDRAFT_163202 [Exserohilum turcica Et28A]|uniref:Uncharacterized protein n=1 Tax=Exserohilum turcicum (strain 28A) TaxID=671987 RepID=R0KGM9_EXST2|nr:uncharacterized protein SETTUDRAFT_163202 [Exserohilum turcica Et28A]EOA87177.1 hypothetical protein SETTUDRAFT_163202 [Exserohilum turcica Et28A]